MSAVTSSLPLLRSSRRRLVGPVLTVVASVAGLATGRLLSEPGSDLLVIALGAIVGLCAFAAWIATQPGSGVLHASGREAFRAELDRARRHRRTFAIARLELAAEVADGTDVGDAADGIDRATIALIGASLRITDRAWLEDGDALILLPESDRATAEAFAERVRAAAPGRFTERLGIAAFPDDGLTSGALLDALERRLNGANVPSPIGRTMAAADGVDPVAVPVAEQVESGIG